MPFAFHCGKVQIMGILNITPDSFSDGGKFFDLDAAVARACEIQAEGADMLDIGAQSTRPGHVPVSAQEEIARLRPVLEALRDKITIPISIDTYYPEAADTALANGVQIVNDVSGVVTQAMADVVKFHGAGWILMHNGGGADALPTYEPDVVTVVREALLELVQQAKAFGIETQRLCVDPGIGFGKTQAENLSLLAHTAQLKIPGMAYLAGASRKRVIGQAVPPEERLAGTIAAHTVAQLGGADILRVHDVKEARQAADLIAALSHVKRQKSKV